MGPYLETGSWEISDEALVEKRGPSSGVTMSSQKGSHTDGTPGHTGRTSCEDGAEAEGCVAG